LIPPERERWIWTSAILLGALALRLILFTGIQGTDDLLYAARAHAVLDGRFEPGGDLFAARVGHVLLIALGFFLFGIHSWTLALPSLISSMLLVGLALRLGRELSGETAGRCAAILVAILPLDVFYATEAHPDLPQASVASLGLFLLWRAVRDSDLRRALLAGVAFAVAHFIKETAVVFLLPAILWARDRKAWPTLGAAFGVFAAAVATEMIAYGATRHDPLLRFHLARSQIEAVQVAPGLGFWSRIGSLGAEFLDPRGACFAFLGLFPWLAGAGAVWALKRDRAQCGWLVVWGAAIALFISFWPLTLIPYRPALSVIPRFFAGAVVPGAVLAARLLVDGPLRLRRGLAWSGAAVVVLVSMIGALQVHADGSRWRRGAEWAHDQLATVGNAPVVTDPRTASMLAFLSGYSPPYRLSSYDPDDPVPPPGTLLLDDERWVAATERWDSLAPPAWWRSPSPARRTVAELTIPGRWRLKGVRGPDEHVVLSEVYSPR
jgi:hypothetical protein